MGHLTLDSFRDNLNISLGNHRQNANERLDTWINTAYFAIASESEYEGARMVATADTVADQHSYSLPEDLFSVISIADLTNKKRLVNIGLRNYHLKDRTVTGNPRYFARRKRVFYLWPTPKSVCEIEVFYTEEICPLLLYDDVTVLPQAYDQVLLTKAREYAWEALGSPERATYYLEVYTRLLNAVKRDVEQSPMVTEGVNVATSFGDLTDMQTSVPD